MSRNRETIFNLNINIADHMYSVAVILGIVCWIVESILIVFLNDINIYCRQ